MTTALRVLLAVDGSDGALAVARTWAAWQGGPARPLQAHLLAVAPPPPHAFAPPAVTPGQVEAALLDWGRQRLAPAQALFAATTLDWQAQVQIGATARLIIDAADPAQVDLIALGTRGINPLRGLLVGSVALRVAQASRVPVWLASAQARAPAALGQRLRLVVAVDGSAEATHAAVWAARIAPRFGEVTLDLVSVQPALAPMAHLLAGGAQPADHWSRRIGEAALDAACDALGAAPPPVTRSLRIGDALDEITRHADEVDADAIVVGPRGLGAIGQALLGSVSSGLLQTSNRPVIVVPGGA
jgi:nucleotide-binding universal stress UspA family protein